MAVPITVNSSLSFCLPGPKSLESSPVPLFRSHPTPNWLEIMLVPLSKHFQNLTVLPTSTWPPLQEASPIPAFWLPCSPVPTVSSPARKSGCVPSAWTAPEQNHRLSKACKALQKLTPPHHRVCSSQLASVRCLQPITRPPPLPGISSHRSYLPGSLPGVLDFGQMPPSQ